jgi:site-specific recombinase XerD
MARANVVRIHSLNPIADDLESAIDCFLAYCSSKNLSSNTIIYYSYRLRALQSYLSANGEPTAPNRLTPQTIRAFLTAEAGRNSATTASHSHTALRAFFGFLVSDGFLESSPMEGVAKPKRRKCILNTFSLEQVEAMISHCGRDFVGVRDRAIITMLLDCGLRASELSGLDTDDVNWADGTLIVLGKGDKERIVPFGSTTRQTLTAYIARRGELDTPALFVSTLGVRLDRHRVRDIIKHRCEQAGIAGVRCSPHTFRHTMAVSFLRNGADVFSLQKLLGHSSLDMTRKYAELSQTDVIERHRLHSPGDRLKLPEPAGRRRRIE